MLSRASRFSSDSGSLRSRHAAPCPRESRSASNTHPLNATVSITASHHESTTSRADHAAHSALLRPRLVMRPYGRVDYGMVRRLLKILPTLYPGGSTWLDLRLDEAASGAARCTLALAEGRLAAIAIEKDKGIRRVKLSTFYVTRNWRRLGIGRVLLKEVVERWAHREIEHGYVTVRDSRSSGLAPLLHSYGFSCASTEKGRYGIDCNELVFVWSPGAWSLTKTGCVSKSDLCSRSPGAHELEPASLNTLCSASLLLDLQPRMGNGVLRRTKG